MSRLITTFVLFGLVSSFPVLAASDQSGSFNIILGYRSFDSDEWDPIEDQPVLGFSYDYAGDGWPVGFLADLYLTAGDDTVRRDVVTVSEVEFTTVELGLGIQKTWDDLFNNAWPYVGGGLSVIRAEIDVSLFGNRSKDDDVSVGLFLNGGYVWKYGEVFQFGFEGRLLLGTDITLGENNKTIVGSGFTPENVDYAQLGFILGWGW